MLKKSGVIFMAVLYLITAAGFAVNLHYCNNQIADISINSPAGGCVTVPVDSCVKSMSMAKSKMNCKDTHLNIKVKDDHQKETTSISAGHFAFALPAINKYGHLFLSGQARSATHADRVPPEDPLPNTPVFLKNCIFRI